MPGDTDEYGIPIRTAQKVTSQPAVDEYGIPFKKKDVVSSPTSQVGTSNTANGTQTTPLLPSQSNSGDKPRTIEDALNTFNKNRGLDNTQPDYDPGMRNPIHVHNDIIKKQQPAVVVPISADHPEGIDWIKVKSQKQVHKELTSQAIENTARNKLKLDGVNPDTHKSDLDFEINFYKQRVDNGDATLHVDAQGNPGLKKSDGFFESFGNSYKNSIKEADDADKFINEMTPQQRIDYYNQKQKDNPNPEYVGQDNSGWGGTLGNLIGSNARFIGKKAIGTGIGVVAGALTPFTGGASDLALPAAGSFLATGTESANKGGMDEVLRRYPLLKQQHPDWTDEQAMQEASKGEFVGRLAGAGTDAIFSVTGEPIAEQPINNAGKSVLENALHNTIKSGVDMGTKSAAVNILKNEIGKGQGVDMKTSDILKQGASEFANNATVGMVLHGTMLAIEHGAPPIVQNAFKYALATSGVPIESVKNALSKQEEVGNIQPGIAEKITTDINDYKNAVDKIPDNISDDKKAQIAPLIQQKDAIVKEQSTKDNSFKDHYQSQIDEIDNKVKDIVNTPEKTPLTKPIEGLDENGVPIDKTISSPLNTTSNEEASNNASPETKGEKVEENKGAAIPKEEAAPSIKSKDKYEINIKEPEDWEENEETGNYDIGTTKNFNVEHARDKIIFNFKDEEKQKKQIEELGQPIPVNLEHDNFNRVHIGGIGHSLLNQGYGKEIYHTLAEANSIISTSHGSSSEDAGRVWDSLIKSGEYYWTKIGDEFTAVSKDESKIDKFIKAKENSYPDDKPPLIKRGEPKINTEPPKESSTVPLSEDSKPELPSKEQESIPPNTPVGEDKKVGDEEPEKTVGVNHAALTKLAEKYDLKNPEKGQYFTPEEYKNRGRFFLAKGADVAEIDNKENELHDRISIGFAHIEKLDKELNDLRREGKLNTPEFKDKKNEVEKLIPKVKELGSKASQAMTSLQGVSDTETDNFITAKRKLEEQQGKPLSKEQEVKLQKLTDENAALKQKTFDLEKKLIEATDNNIGKEPDKNSKQFTKTAKDVADKFRKLKNKPFTFKDSEGNDVPIYSKSLSPVEWNDIIELGAKAIEKTGKIADGVSAIIDKIKDSDFYKKLKDEDREGLRNQLSNHYKSIIEETPEGKRIQQLEKRLTDLREGKIPEIKTQRERTDREQSLLDLIKKEKEALGLNEKIKPISSSLPKDKSTEKLYNLMDLFADKRGNKFSPEEARALWDYAKSEYLNKGVEYKDMIGYVSNDLGLSWKQVNEGITSTKTKPISDEMWRKQAELRKQQIKTKDYIDKANKSAAGKVIKGISDAFRSTAVFGHGGIFVGTHAGMTLFDIPRTKYTIKAFLNSWKFAYGNEAAYEREMQELKSSKNFTLAQRAGLQNDPNETNTDDYQKYQKFFAKLGMSGVKGFNSIKILRQDLFDSHFNNLNEVQKSDPSVAKSIAELVNNATGATNATLPKWVQEVSFAGGMEAARWEKLTSNPTKATSIALKAIFSPEKATASEKVFAKVWARRVGSQLATYSSILVANAALQSLINPKNKTNITDPSQSDWLKFKFGEKNIDMTSGMLGAVGFISKLIQASTENQKKLRGDTRLQAIGKTSISYVRGKLSPAIGTAADIATQSDFGGNPLPFSSDKPRTGKHTLTWAEYGWEKAPIPVADAAKTVYDEMEKNGLSKPAIENIFSGIATGIEASSTGFRVTDSQKQPSKYSDIQPFTIYNPSNATKRQSTPEEIEKYGTLRDQLINEKMSGIENQDIGFDMYGDVTTNDDKIVDTKPYSKLTDEQKNKLKTIYTTQASSEAKKQLFGEDQ